MELEDIFLIAVSTIGFISVLKHSLSLIKWIYAMFLRPTKNLKEYGNCAMVTGSTDGIGKAMAFELASKGLNLVLVGRNPSKLEATKAEIQSMHKVDVKNIVVDLAKCSGEEIKRLINDGIKGLDVGILVNNAGVAYPYPRYFHEVDLELMESILRVNIVAATWVIKSVIPAMLEKKKGAIVNIGSASSVILPSYPLYTVYAATKAYLAMLSRCIGLEYKQNGIDIQCQIPMLVATTMTLVKKSNFIVVSPKKYAKSSIRWIGYDQLCSPVLSHQLQWYLAMLSRCIGLEYKQNGIDIQCQIPMLVATTMTLVKKSNFIVVSPKKYAKSSIRWIGYDQLCSPVLSHQLQWFAMHALPNSLLNWSAFCYFQGFRKRGLARDAKKLKYSTSH